MEKPKSDPQKHHRRSIRLLDHDYSRASAYFVTLVAWERECIFGKIVNEEMQTSIFGEIVRQEWAQTPDIRREVELGIYIVMPNHFHGIVIFNDDAVGAHGRALHGIAYRLPRSLGSMIAGFKSSVTKRINLLRDSPGVPVWQRNYGACPERSEGSILSVTTRKCRVFGIISIPIH